MRSRLTGTPVTHFADDLGRFKSDGLAPILLGLASLDSSAAKWIGQLMTPPTMAGWNLALRFGLELAMLAGYAAAAWNLTSGGVRWVAAIAVMVGVATVWGVFNVLNDPSRSGKAPVEVSGWTRLVLELLVFGVGALAISTTGRPALAIGFAALVVLQYATSWDRVQWLIKQ